MTDATPRTTARPATIFWMLALITGAALPAVTGRSFWIDECTTAEFAKIPALADCWRAMRHYPEVQVPLYMLYVRGWVQLFGSGEWVLRAAGLPWFVAGAAIYSVGAGRRLGTVLLPALLISWSAFACYYLNEARVYSLQLGVALALVGSGAMVLSSNLNGPASRPWWRCFLASLFLLCGTSPLGAVWGFCFFAAFLLILPRRHWTELLRSAPISTGMCAAGLTALAAYYAWTLTLPARPTGGITNAQSMAFVLYELLGISGWGPGRLELRTAGTSALKPFLVFVIPFALLLGVVSWNGFKELVERFTLRRTLGVMLMVAAPLLIIGTLGIVTHFRVLGRHATPLLPMLLLVLAHGIIRLARHSPGLGRALAGVFLIGCLGSTLMIRFAPRHEKDDYRAAAARAKSAAESGQHVWWNAEPLAAAYYQIAGHPRIVTIMNSPPELLPEQPAPGLIVVSRPEGYDNTGAVAAYLRAHDYQVVEQQPPFVFWSSRKH